MTRTEFFEKVYNCSLSCALAIPVSVMLAQAALESAYGESGLTKNANALFGIKADSTWTGKTYNAKTAEVYDNTLVYIKADFRAYNSWEDSISDHSTFLWKNKRYNTVTQTTDPIACCDELQKAGYATDPAYSSKLKSLITQYNLRDYDKKRANNNAPPVPSEPSGKVKNIQVLANPGDTINIQVIVTSNN